jgi:hypothetical protein
MRRRDLILVLLVLPVWVFFPLIPAAGQTTLGIQEGDFFSYRFITSWRSNNSSASPPSIFQAFSEREVDDYLILAVAGDTVTLSANIVYQNGTVLSEEITATWYEQPIALMFIPAGLSAGDTIPHEGVVINETIYRAYADESRLTNHYITRSDLEQYSNVAWDTFWDKTTGVTVESSISYSRQVGGTYTEWTASFLLNYTDLWNVPEFPHPAILLVLFAALTLLAVGAYKNQTLGHRKDTSLAAG